MEVKMINNIHYTTPAPWPVATPAINNHAGDVQSRFLSVPQNRIKMIHIIHYTTF